MATTGNEVLTLLDYAKRVDPETNSTSTKIAELLSQTNQILDDMTWREGNLETGERLTMRTGLPTGVWARYNMGTPTSKSTTVQVDETCGMYYQRSQIDLRVAQLSKDVQAFRLSESMPHFEAMSQEMAQTIFYGSLSTSPNEFDGLASRYSTISGAVNGQNIIDAQGSSSVNTSVWLLGWGEQSVYGITPRNSKMGIDHKVIQDNSGDGCYDVRDSDGNSYRAFVDEYSWKAGLALKDWRYVVRIANIDTANLVAETSAADLVKLMSRALDRIPMQGRVKLVFYANRTIFSMLRIQGLNKSGSALSVEQSLNQFGQPMSTLKFLGVPVKLVDQLVNTEARVT